MATQMSVVNLVLHIVTTLLDVDVDILAITYEYHLEHSL